MNETDTSKAIKKLDGEEIHAFRFSEEEWVNLKKNYHVGDFLMTCCSGIAIPKTSENGLQFFAHLAGECGSAPETIWHRSAKEMIQNFCDQRCIVCKTEESDVSNRKWRADIMINHNGRKIAIEIQHSYQHRDDFFRRQLRYKDDGIIGYWLLRKDVYRTLVSTEQKHRIRTEHGGKLPQNFAICRPELPIAFLETDPNVCVMGAGQLKTSFESWITSILENRFIFDEGVWKIA